MENKLKKRLEEDGNSYDTWKRSNVQSCWIRFHGLYILKIFELRYQWGTRYSWEIWEGYADFLERSEHNSYTSFTEASTDADNFLYSLLLK